MPVSGRRSPARPQRAVRVRRATAADAPALARLRFEFRSALTNAVEPERDFLARATRWMSGRLAASFGPWHAWVVARDQRIEGAIWLLVVEKIPNPNAEPEEHAYLTNLFVRPGERGRGVGSALLRSALRWCRSRRVHSAILWPTPRSRALYVRHGFTAGDALMQREFLAATDAWT